MTGRSSETPPSWQSSVPPLVLHVIPTRRARGAQREARALADRLDRPGVRVHRVLSLFAGPDEVRADVALDHPGGDRPAVGFDPRLVLTPAPSGSPAWILRWSSPTAASRSSTWCRPWPVTAYHSPTTPSAPTRAPGARPSWPSGGSWPPGPTWSPPRAARWPRSASTASGSRPTGSWSPPTGAIRPSSIPAAHRLPVNRPWLSSAPSPTASGPTGSSRWSPTCAPRATTAEPCSSVTGLGVPRSRSRLGRRASRCSEHRSDIAEQLRSADVFVFPSAPAGEGMPGVLIEAGLSGLPVVATAVPGVASVLADGQTGIVVEVDDRPSHGGRGGSPHRGAGAASGHGRGGPGAVRAAVHHRCGERGVAGPAPTAPRTCQPRRACARTRGRRRRWGCRT